MTVRSHSRSQEPRSPQEGATGGAGREDGSTGQQGASEAVYGESLLWAVSRELDLVESTGRQQLAVFKRCRYGETG